MPSSAFVNRGFESKADQTKDEIMARLVKRGCAVKGVLFISRNVTRDETSGSVIQVIYKTLWLTRHFSLLTIC